MLEKIRITAQKRSENLQSVPLAAAVFSGDQLAARAVFRMADLQTLSPSLSITDAGPTESVNIRGIGLATVSPAASNGVAQYSDGLFQPQIVTRRMFYDVQNVEVLRGPQGTLVGTDSTGGAIFVNNRNPELDAPGGYGQIGYGNYDAKTAQGAINLPIADTLALRVAGNYAGHGSFYTSVGPVRTDASKLDEKSLRLGLLWKPGSLRALAKVEYTDRDTGGYAWRPTPGTQYASFTPPAAFNLAYDSRTENYERALLSELDLRFEWENGIALRSLTGYQDRRVSNLFDDDATAEVSATHPMSSGDQHIRQRDWSHEINLLSPTNGPADWLLGHYLLRSYINILLVTTTAGFPVGLSTSAIRTTTGAFAQFNYHLTPRYAIQVGARYSTFRVEGDGGVEAGARLPGSPAQAGRVVDLGGRHHDDRPTGKVALNLTPDDNNLLYAFMARGYKPGGANSPVSDFDPETVRDYEGGWKTTFLEGGARAQIGVFYDDYDNFQFQITDPSSGQIGVKNIAKARITGIELQVQARLGAASVDGAAAYVHSHLSAVSVVNSRLLPPGSLGPQCPESATPGCFDYARYIQTNGGGPNLYSPKLTLHAGLQIRLELPNGDGLTPRLDYSYLSPQYTSVLYSPVSDYLRSRGLLSALLTLQLRRGWTLDAYGTNLTDKTYVSGQFLNDEFMGAPRQYGARVTKQF